MPKILVSGAAGFIGFHFAKKLLGGGHQVVGLDNLDPYYDVALKQARLKQLTALPGFHFAQFDICDHDRLQALFAEHQFDVVVNLAAQAGVRYSLVNPQAYIHSNIVGFVEILEMCRHHSVGHLVYASSSSVYGAVTHMPFSTHEVVDHPLSVYGATKKSNELLAHSYSSLYSLPTTGLRFFTVYGPWGRPDMALFLFTKAIVSGEPIKIFNNGEMQRDFTYVDDIVEAMARLIDRPAASNPAWNGDRPDPATSSAPYRIYNIGNHSPVKLMHFIEVLERCLGQEAIKQYLPMQQGDVPATYADVDDLARDVGFSPDTPIEVGIQRFVDWYREYHRL